MQVLRERLGSACPLQVFQAVVAKYQEEDFLTVVVSAHLNGKVSWQVVEGVKVGFHAPPDAYLPHLDTALPS